MGPSSRSLQHVEWRLVLGSTARRNFAKMTEDQEHHARGEFVTLVEMHTALRKRREVLREIAVCLEVSGTSAPGWGVSVVRSNGQCSDFTKCLAMRAPQVACTVSPPVVCTGSVGVRRCPLYVQVQSMSEVLHW